MGFGLCIFNKVIQKISEADMKLALRQLKRKLPGCVQTDLAAREYASVDNLRISILPDAVIQVKKAEEVGVVLKLANRYGVPVTARGAGSSATGSAIPINSGWVLDLSLLKSIKLNQYSKLSLIHI